MNNQRSDAWQKVGLFAGISAATETGLGSILHGLNIPMRGHFLANLQGLVLASFAKNQAPLKRHIFLISLISAALKSLSPAGKRLRPMFAIATQGLLFHCSVNILGTGILGLITGQMMIGAWVTIQPYAFQYIFFGKDLLKSYETLFHLISRALPFELTSPLTILGAWVAINMAASALIGLIFYQSGTFQEWALRPRNTSLKKTPLNLPKSFTHEIPPWNTSMRESLKELAHPYFLTPFIFVLFFSWLAHKNLEHLGVIAMRAIAIAFVCFLLVRRFNFVFVAYWLSQKGFKGPALALENALIETAKRLSGQ
ncbi:MAG: hypothetical protein HY547_04430 [Elusimicrobia bacterium]|nr:hypothetical protein [Elusimicrobiota bacterium]